MSVKNVSLLLFLISAIVYTYFFRIVDNEEMATYFKPIIIPAIGFYYYVSKTRRQNFLHYLILFLIFIADNANLFRDSAFYQTALTLFTIVLVLLIFLMIQDSKLIEKRSKFYKNLSIFFIAIGILFFVFKMLSIFVFKKEFAGYYFVTTYIIVFLGVFVFSLYNLFVRKTKSSKYIFLTLLSLLFSDFFAIIDMYYFPSKWLVYLSCLAGIPCYYFLVQFFINRDLEQENFITE